MRDLGAKDEGSYQAAYTSVCGAGEQSPSARSSHTGGKPEAVTLRDGTEVVVRPVQPDDAPRLQTLFARLSPQSIWLRFLGHSQELSDQQAEALVNVDYQTSMALLATVEQGGEEQVIALAQYAQIPGAEPGLGEAAIVVEDRYQGRGLGTFLLRRLVHYARGHGVSAFLAQLRQENYRIMEFIQRSGLATGSELHSGVWQIKVSLGSERQA